MKHGLLIGLLFGLCTSTFIFSTAILFRYVGYGVIYGLYCGAGTALFVPYLPSKLAKPLVHKAIDAKSSLLSVLISVFLIVAISIGLTAYICRSYVWKVTEKVSANELILTAFVGFLGFAICRLLVHRLEKKEEKAKQL